MTIKYDGTNPYNTRGTDFGTIYMDDGRRAFLLDSADAINIGTDGDVDYVSNTVDEAGGNTYTIKWQTLADWDGEDEQYACDWDEFEVVED